MNINKIGKIILFIAIALHVSTFFMDMLVVWERSGVASRINGFYIINLEDEVLYPIPGILSVIWIGINMIFLFKSKLRNITAYIVMAIINSLCFLLFTALVMTKNLLEQERVYVQSGLYVLLVTFIVYAVAYILMSKKQNT
ncbi:MAG: hypothetical protein LBK94_03655 [Prevotellaceae bacterium]|jgi:hypothetical protein|nr:hypothetical protein [Prevotellaceae bacterium]